MKRFLICAILLAGSASAQQATAPLTSPQPLTAARANASCNTQLSTLFENLSFSFGQLGSAQKQIEDMKEQLAATQRELSELKAMSDKK